MASLPLALVLAGLVTGCGVSIADGPPGKADDGSGAVDAGGINPDDAKPLTAFEYLTMVAAIECHQMFTCLGRYPGTAAAFVNAFGANELECTANTLTDYTPGVLEAEIAAHKVNFDSAAAASCIASFLPPMCEQFWGIGPQHGPDCILVIVGTVPAGGRCTTHYDCATVNASCDAITNLCRQ